MCDVQPSTFWLFSVPSSQAWSLSTSPAYLISHVCWCPSVEVLLGSVPPSRVVEGGLFHLDTGLSGTGPPPFPLGGAVGSLGGCWSVDTTSDVSDTLKLASLRLDPEKSTRAGSPLSVFLGLELTTLSLQMALRRYVCMMCVCCV